VDVGEAESRRIVCGADNLQEGLYVPVAKEGAVLPDGTEIESRKIRGEQSYGMICSANELQVRGKETGIKVLSEEHEPGTSLAIVFGDEDYILEIDT
ncbi:MAG: phenylalanine--tRNA ligase subunit beta, partial [Candidatus Paceibacteria bacterium]